VYQIWFGQILHWHANLLGFPQLPMPEFWPELEISKEQVFHYKRENKFSTLTFQNEKLLPIKLTQIFCDVDDFCRSILCKMRQHWSVGILMVKAERLIVPNGKKRGTSSLMLPRKTILKMSGKNLE
jgi:hypothetical protein